MREWVAFEAALLVAWLGIGKWGLRSGTRGTVGVGRRGGTELDVVLVKEGDEALGGSIDKVFRNCSSYSSFRSRFSSSDTRISGGSHKYKFLGNKRTSRRG